MKENNFHSIESIPYSIRNAIKRTADKNEKFSGTKYKKLNERNKYTVGIRLKSIN